MTDYGKMLKMLRNMTDEQLIQLFHDLDDLDTVADIASLASSFYAREINKSDYIGQSDHDEWRNDDAMRRTRELQSER